MMQPGTRNRTIWKSIVQKGSVPWIGNAILLATIPWALIFANGCGGSSTATAASSSSTAASNAYAIAYQALAWQSGATVTFPTSCTMTITTTGVPPYHASYYLAPTSTQYPTAVAYTPISNTAMSVVPYTPSSITGATATINICPTKASSTTSTNMGTIGYMVSGEAIFNPYEGGPNPPPAMSDNVSYTFTSNGTSYTASFIDQCNSHPTPLANGYDWHHHGIPTCLVATVDGTSGPSHMIGIALDGFPIYGGRDINGAVINTSQLDACNGITSSTPEFPSGAYHYVLPYNVTGNKSSINCYAGSVSPTLMAQASQKHCDMKSMQPAKRPRHATAMKPMSMAAMGI